MSKSERPGQYIEDYKQGSRVVTSRVGPWSSSKKAKSPTLPSFILTHLPRDLIEFRAISDLLQRFFFLGVLFAEDVAHVDAGCGLELGFAVGFAVAFVASCVFGFVLVFGWHGWGELEDRRVGFEVIRFKCCVCRCGCGG